MTDHDRCTLEKENCAMDIGAPVREIVIEPLEEPAPEAMPEDSPSPAPEPELVPA